MTNPYRKFIKDYVILSTYLGNRVSLSVFLELDNTVLFLGLKLGDKEGV